MKLFGKELKFNNNKVYHAGDKPTPSEIGAAAASHGTHVTWATTAPKANGTAAVGTVARVAREDHVHPLQTTVSGNAGTATKLQTGRTLTIGSTGKSFDGSANVSWSLNEIGAATGKTASATTAATAQWYRIATSPAGMNRCIGNFTIEATVSGKHSVTNLIAGVNYGVNPTIQQIAHSDYSAPGITKARIVYHTTYNNNYAYLEVYQPTATATQISVSAVNLVGWTLVAPNTVGSIPSGYTSKEITFVNNKIVANIQGSVSGSASSATKATQDSAGQQINTTYIKGLSVSGKTITYTKGDGTTGTITTQDTNTTYSTGTASALGLTKLYTGTGTATDGTMTQAAIKSALDGKANSSHGRHVPDACATITDWNSATTNGWYMANNAANAPTTGVWYFGEVIAHNTNYVFQTVYQFNASSDAKGIPKYIRAKMNGTWGAWTNVTVAKAVPSNAVFTDTNTWRGVQNNLTSDATDQSLSAAQGKVLKGLVDGKAASSHTHNYAGSSSAGGAATTALACTGNSATATKLATARTIALSGIVKGSASFDGSGNVTISVSANDITTITKSLKVTTSWMDTGITGTNLTTGTYAVQMYVNDGTNTSQYQETYSGIMSWFNGTTNSGDADEILLHKAGHASNSKHVYLRTIRTTNSGYLKLQICSSSAFTAASSITFKFKKLI